MPVELVEDEELNKLGKQVLQRTLTLAGKTENKDKTLLIINYYAAVMMFCIGLQTCALDGVKHAIDELEKQGLEAA